MRVLPVRACPALSLPCPRQAPGPVPGLSLCPRASMWPPGTGIQSVPSLYRVALVGVVPWPYPPPVLPRDHRPSRYRTRTHPSRYRTGSPTPSSGPVVNPQPQNSTGPVAKSYKTDRYRTATHSDSRRMCGPCVSCSDRLFSKIALVPVPDHLPRASDPIPIQNMHALARREKGDT